MIYLFNIMPNAWLNDILIENPRFAID